MTLFSNPTHLHSHRVRFVLTEKEISLDVVDVDPTEFPKKLLAINLCQSLSKAERALRS